MALVRQLNIDYPELDFFYEDEPFEVDGILYIPPAHRDEETADVHARPMFELELDYCVVNGCSCD